MSATLFVCLFAAQSAFLVLGPILPDVAREFGISSAAAGQLRTFSGIAGGVTALALAALGRRVDLRGLLTLGLSLLLVASLVSALAPTFAVLAVAQLAIGVGIAILATSVFVAGGRTLAGSAHGLIAASDRRVAVTSIRAAATQFGNLLGVGLGGAALALGGYGALGAALAVLLTLAVVPHVAGLTRRAARLEATG